MSGANRRAAEQMERDGIRTLKRWTKPKGYFGIQVALDHGQCLHPACHKNARYSTPLGNRCFEHAISQRTDPTA